MPNLGPPSHPCRQMFSSQRLAAAAHGKELVEAQARVRAQRQLAAAQAQAAQRALSVAREKAANEAKSEFMSLMCHEVGRVVRVCVCVCGACVCVCVCVCSDTERGLFNARPQPPAQPLQHPPQRPTPYTRRSAHR